MRTQVDKTGQLPDHGATLSVPIPGPSLKFTPRSGVLWVPPAWFARNHPQLPVIELLHGTPGDPSNWTKSSYADATALAFAEQHHGIAPILVMPDINGSWGGDTECVNSTMYGDVETYLTKTVPQYMRKNFNASTAAGLDRDSRAVRGRSLRYDPGPEQPQGVRGLRQLLRRRVAHLPERQHAADHRDLVRRLARELRRPQSAVPADPSAFHRLAGWFEAGAQDSEGLQAARTLQDWPPARGSTPAWRRHRVATIRPLDAGLLDSLPWLSWKLKLTPQPKSVPAQCAAGKN